MSGIQTLLVLVNVPPPDMQEAHGCAMLPFARALLSLVVHEGEFETQLLQ